MSTGITSVKNDFQITVDKMMSQAGSIPAAMARVYSIYQKLQTQRFMTENESEGERWRPLSTKYAQRKSKQFGKYPGGGSKLMIATGTLAGATIGPGAPFDGVDRHRFITTSTGMTVSVEQTGKNAAGRPFTYPEFAAEQRPIMRFSEASIDKMKEELKKFIVGF